MRGGRRLAVSVFCACAVLLGGRRSFFSYPAASRPLAVDPVLPFSQSGPRRSPLEAPDAGATAGSDGGGGAVLAAAALWAAARPRAPAPTAVAKADAPAESKATAAALLAEVVKDDRNLDTITALVRTLEEGFTFSTQGKLKRLLATTWRIDYASDEAALEPFLAGMVRQTPLGPLDVLEGVIPTFKVTGEFNFFEVTRPLGPFGNAKASLCGRWSITKDVLRWRASYMIDARGREKDVEKKMDVEARVSFVSPEAMILRTSPAPETAAGAEDRGLLVFARVPLKGALEELKVYTDEE